MAKKLLLTLAVLLVTVSVASAEIYTPFKATSLNDGFMQGLQRIYLYGDEIDGGVVTQRDSDVLEANTNPARFAYFYGYRFKLTDNPLTEFLKSQRFFYAVQWDFTGATVLPDAPIDATGASNVDYVYYYIALNQATSLGSTAINDVPTTWRKYRGTFRFVFERQFMTEQQQLGIIDGLEREILAGAGEDYTSTSTTTRIIDFEHASSGANDPITKAELQARGWTDVNASQSEKFFNDINGTPRRWRVLHND